MPHSFRSDITAHRKLSSAVRLLGHRNTVTPSDWHVVDHQMLHVVLMNTFVQKLHVTLMLLAFQGVITPAEQLSVYNLGKVNLLNIELATISVLKSPYLIC